MSSKRAIKRRMCDGKRRHENFNNAMIARKIGGIKLNSTMAYKCKFCKMWHLGHPKKNWK